MRLPRRLRALTGTIAGGALAADSLRRTARNPGADLARLPLGLDLRAISIIDGIRAALACALIILIEEGIGWPPLLYMALAANLTCFSDAGGPLRPRLAGLLAFSVFGAVLWCSFGLLRGTGPAWLIIVAASLVVFCTSFARVLGQPAMAAGNVMTVVLVLALDRPLTVHDAPVVGGMFLAGGAWATLLAVLFWRLDPYTQARGAVADVWRQLAALAADLRALGRRSDRVTDGDWDAHARAHRRAVRMGIEAARQSLGDLIKVRGGASPRTAQALLRLETAEQLFGAVVALSDLMEDDAARKRRGAGYRLLRRLTPVLAMLAQAMGKDEAMAGDALPATAAIERTMTRVVAATVADPALHAVASAIDDRVRIALKLFASDAVATAKIVADERPWSFRETILQPVRANLTWDSAILRHALRAAVVAVPTIAIVLAWQGAFSHWLAITVVLTMQPFFAATWQRALERIAGTVVGGMVGALLVHAATTPLALAGLMFPLCIIGFSARQVSYGAFIACLMPQLVVLIELLLPGTSTWYIVEMRVLFSLAGGVIAVVGCLLLWPSWEHDRLRQQLVAAIRAIGQFADAVLGAALGETPPPAVEESRRRAGVAINNLEASISRALQEPGRKGHRRRLLEQAMVADATLRRLGGRLSVLQHDRASPAALPAEVEGWQAWRMWMNRAFTALGEGRPIGERPAASAGTDALSRIARQIELLAGAIEPGIAPDRPLAAKTADSAR